MIFGSISEILLHSEASHTMGSKLEKMKPVRHSALSGGVRDDDQNNGPHQDLHTYSVMARL